MARPNNKLSVKFTEKDDLKPGLYGDGGGLYLQVSDFKTKAWVFRYMMAGRARKMGLGDFDLVSLKDARKKRDAAYGLVVDGIDPIEERKARKAEQAVETAKAVTFKECAERYIKAHKAGWKSDKHAGQWEATLKTYAYPVVGNLPVAAIDVGLVLKVIEPIWTTKTETASRVRGRIETVLSWARARGYRKGENPATWRGHLDQLLPARSQVAPVDHHAALPYSALPAFMAKLRANASISARALEFTILTAARTGDTIGGKWPEIDKAEKLWTVPKERVKGKKGARKRDHVVPLSKQAMALLEDLPTEGDYLFPGGKKDAGLSNAAMSELLKGMGYAPDVATVHGFRSTFKDWCMEQTAYGDELSEMALAHTIKDKVKAAYHRGDMLEKRRRLMADWASYCDRPPIVAGQNVTAIREARA
ncbi:integrase arm-type DNA-binding domain-containing protein [Bradyrhizobium sediminis]|uniref:Integrase arm-type DNA-binding domain-containing protein n=1 Tax=Bradyrhizobium sediminis TaxID=2840469 RepID=A0A975NJ58_9BRAD|nr:site-specific integrase [Bradyrhizobium sediminis]QWG16133.1 integrase arm-type DNA-binding domain-containing protein [Bradyrhizobium sediminis]